MLTQLLTATAKNLASRGMPKDILRMRPFDLEHHLVSIDSQVDGIKTRRVLKKTQLAHFDRFMEHPFALPQIVAVSSFPNDGKAKMLAAYMMQRAYKAHISGKFRLTRSRHLPIWHTLHGGYYDNLRDGRSEEKPSLLVLSNITQDSTQVKFEKLRDLLEMYNDIPRIIVMTSNDPLTIANTRLFMPINTALYLATARKVEL